MNSGSSRSGGVKKAIIIGSGFAGLGMAIALKKNKINDFTILEKGNDVGGVWRENTYPGAACDVPSHLYSFSFYLNPNWTRKFAPQSEIYAYLQDCAKKFNLLPKIQFGAEVSAASFNDVEKIWEVTLKSGDVLYSEILITGMGQLSMPAYPKLEGINDFQGKAFHSAKWDHSYDLNGKRIGVIGTGASAIQFVPAIAPKLKNLSVFQRSPSYIMPRPDRAYTKLEHKLWTRLPFLLGLQRLVFYIQYESRAIAFTRFKSLMKIAVGIPFRKLMNAQVVDPELRKKMTPEYQIGCKRILLSSNYLNVFNNPNVNLVTENIRRIVPKGVETADGKVHEFDALIYGTGFAATDFLTPLSIKGIGGRDLNEAWSKGAKAYLGISVPSFPNFFILYGPNTNLGHNSIVYMLESQIAHVIKCIGKMHQTESKTIEVLPNIYEQYTSKIQRDLARTVWADCKSWYVDAKGFNSTSWPGFTFTYRWLSKHADLDAYQFS